METVNGDAGVPQPSGQFVGEKNVGEFGIGIDLAGIIGFFRAQVIEVDRSISMGSRGYINDPCGRARF